MFRKILLIAAVTAILGASASAQQVVGHDPTTLDRYDVIGHEQSYPAAKVLKTLPAGITCGPAGEAVGAEYFNSTGNGTANRVLLKKNATVAITNEGLFLCRCIGGYNKLFKTTTTEVVQQEQETSLNQQNRARAEASSSLSFSPTLTFPQPQQQVARNPVCGFETVALNPNKPKKLSTFWKCDDGKLTCVGGECLGGGGSDGYGWKAFFTDLAIGGAGFAAGRLTGGGNGGGGNRGNFTGPAK